MKQKHETFIGQYTARVLTPKYLHLSLGLSPPLSPYRCMHANIGALMITYTILGVPYYIFFSIMGPQSLFYVLRPLE